MSGLTDMHCHILPGLDDGAQDMDESLDALYDAYQQGITAVIATPHFFPEKYEPAPEQIMQAIDDVRRACREEGINVTIYPGQELMYYNGLVDLLEQKRVLTMAGSRYVLVEFDTGCSWNYLHGALRELRDAGYTPIVAHFERFGCLFEGGHAEQLKKEGYLIQMNFGRLLEKDTFLKKNKWRRYLQDGVVDYLGSDCHGTHYRPYRVAPAAEWLEKGLPRDVRKRVLQENIDRILYDM